MVYHFSTSWGERCATLQQPGTQALFSVSRKVWLSVKLSGTKHLLKYYVNCNSILSMFRYSNRGIYLLGFAAW